MRYLLDTNAMSELMRGPVNKVASAIATVGSDAVCTSIIVASELKFGAAKKRSAKLTANLEKVLATIVIEDFKAPADAAYAELRAALEKAGTPIGQMDMLIAAHALALDATLVTANEREFSRVPGLKVENWMK
ncbi:type II toxin-antitoxin system VapC family toxin [Rhizobium sp. C4]|uniref:type II toxin-antitoxin system VapC family toxin n=1 Tax=Rhizobium sp. C4 TaxID=1349800 RepID=UPI001E63FDB0|nr:type II toxin-antitoxin system VapC family toxin [Rhizobium sp. C4]MCD2174068.1 type II toxin-antitoxin system VapC family toxin [Rhizobium sp. C4]